MLFPAPWKRNQPKVRHQAPYLGSWQKVCPSYWSLRPGKKKLIFSHADLLIIIVFPVAFAHPLCASAFLIKMEQY